MKSILVSALAVLISSASLAQSHVAQSLPDPTPEASPNATDAMVKEPKEKAAAEAGGAIQKARVFFIEPKNGATVAKTFKVKMGVEGLKVRPAGEAPDEVTSGHHHLLIDQQATKAGEAIAADDKHIHFGKGQTETELTLPSGKHTLTLQFADGAHRSFGPKMSQTITITVK